VEEGGRVEHARAVMHACTYLVLCCLLLSAGPYVVPGRNAWICRPEDQRPYGPRLIQANPFGLHATCADQSPCATEI
jgi:hypothetical protein